MPKKDPVPSIRPTFWAGSQLRVESALASACLIPTLPLPEVLVIVLVFSLVDVPI